MIIQKKLLNFNGISNNILHHASKQEYFDNNLFTMILTSHPTDGNSYIIFLCIEIIMYLSSCNWVTKQTRHVLMTAVIVIVTFSRYLLVVYLFDVQLTVIAGLYINFSTFFSLTLYIYIIIIIILVNVSFWVVENVQVWLCVFSVITFSVIWVNTLCDFFVFISTKNLCILLCLK